MPLALGSAVALGCGARLAARVGSDVFGRFAHDALTSAGIQDEYLVESAAALSPLTFSGIANAGGRAAFFSSGDLGALTTSEFEAKEFLSGTRALLIDGSAPGPQIVAAEFAREHGIPVLLLGTSLRDGIGELVALADVLIAHERFATELAPRGELHDSLAELQRLGPTAVVITLGEAGCVALHGKELVEQPAFPVEVVDTDGAKEAFMGAFAAGLLSDLPLPQCIRFASAAAAIACSADGPWGALPSREGVMHLLRNHGP